MRLSKSSVIGLLAGLMFMPAATGASDEAALRVAYVYKFIKFIEWPNLHSTLRLCALGARDDARQALEPLKGKVVNAQVIDGKQMVQAIELIYLDDPQAVNNTLKTCQMVYRPMQAFPLAIPRPLPAGVVFVADEPPEQDPDLSIALVRNPNGHIEFFIDQTAVNNSGVSFSSQLLKLAKTIKEDNTK